MTTLTERINLWENRHSFTIDHYLRVHKIFVPTVCRVADGFYLRLLAVSVCSWQSIQDRLWIRPGVPGYTAPLDSVTWWDNAYTGCVTTSGFPCLCLCCHVTGRLLFGCVLTSQQPLTADVTSRLVSVSSFPLDTWVIIREASLTIADAKFILIKP